MAEFFSLRRFKAVIYKEFIQMRRDRITFAMMIGIPLMQLILFGYAINSDPRHLPTAVLAGDNSPVARSIVSGMQTSTYFTITQTARSRAEVQRLLKDGRIQFALTIPADFQRDMLRGLRPTLLLEADATDPAATSGALKSMGEIVNRAIERELGGGFPHLIPANPPLEMKIHAQYNPEAVTQYNIVPGLMGVILTLTLIMITALAITREHERGTMENLLSMPVTPLEVMLGKIVPYIIVGYVQVGLILIASRILFDVPMHGSVLLLLILSLIFIAANLTVGVTLSTMARNQLQAVQLSIFFFLPSLLLSGFMFPFRGMPQWAQYIGSVLPLTHYLRMVRGILLKGNGLADSLVHVWPMLIFWLAAIIIGLKRYRRTLD